jgi:predicted secreted protein
MKYLPLLVTFALASAAAIAVEPPAAPADETPPVELSLDTKFTEHLRLAQATETTCQAR